MDDLEPVKPLEHTQTLITFHQTNKQEPVDRIEGHDALFKPGPLNLISASYESLDYETIENELLKSEHTRKGFKYFDRKNMLKWVAFMQIGVITAVIGAAVDLTIRTLNFKKYETLNNTIIEHQNDRRLLALLTWILLNTIPFTMGCFIVTYIEPMAAGSGIPLIKCYLNGVRIPRILTLKTLIIKALGLIFSILGGVASGKEGPMIHVGACVANIVAKGHFTLLGYKQFREDQEKRDLVSAGAAAGVSAAFGASVGLSFFLFSGRLWFYILSAYLGGVLFSLEEGASFWSQTLTWRIFFTSVVSKFCVNFLLSAFTGHPGDLEHPSLINMGTVDFKYSIFELPLFAIMGIMGGFMGAFWNKLNNKLTQCRAKYIKRKWMRVMEGAIVAAFHALIAYAMTFYVRECTDRPYDKTYSLKALCGNTDQSNVVGTMWLSTPQKSVNALVHDPNEAYQITSLVSFAFAYFFLSCITFGLSSSNGIFVPSLLTGAAWGRLLSVLVINILPPQYASRVDCGKYALIGACAQLGGIVRMTISLTVIMMETSDNISFSLPIIITLLCAKWTGDMFSDALYNIKIQQRFVPFLYPEKPPMTYNIHAREVMNKPVICLKGIERVSYVWGVLKNTTHHGFPIIEELEPRTLSYFEGYNDVRTGRVKGMILRSQIYCMLMHKLFYEHRQSWGKYISIDIFPDCIEQGLNMNSFGIEDVKHLRLDFRPFMNNSPYTILHNSSLSRMYNLFRALGLRHLPVVDDHNIVVGIITRKDLSKYRIIAKRGKLVKLNTFIVQSGSREQI